MSILDSIKGERKLSLGHWRFRILHWAFNVKEANPECLAATGLPTFLYTHYCPLFHLTNIIALLSPFILLFKLAALLAKATYALIDLVPIDKICDFFSRLRTITTQEVQEKVIDFSCLLEKDRKNFIKFLCEHPGVSFETIWGVVSFSFLSREEAEKVYNQYMPKINEAHERAKIRKEKWRQRIIFWTNFSRVFIKWFMNVAYVGLAIGLMYLGYESLGVIGWIFGQLFKLVCWLFSDAISFSFLIMFGKVVLWGFAATFLIALLIKLRVFEKFWSVLKCGFNYIFPPLCIVFVPFRWIKAGFNNTVEFISMFYEENCPPIQIVSEEEAMIESVVEKKDDNS